jgi:hypothetical protein
MPVRDQSPFDLAARATISAFGGSYRSRTWTRGGPWPGQERLLPHSREAELHRILEACDSGEVLTLEMRQREERPVQRKLGSEPDNRHDRPGCSLLAYTSFLYSYHALDALQIANERATKPTKHSRGWRRVSSAGTVRWHGGHGRRTRRTWMPAGGEGTTVQFQGQGGMRARRGCDAAQRLDLRAASADHRCCMSVRCIACPPMLTMTQRPVPWLAKRYQ